MIASTCHHLQEVGRERRSALTANRLSLPCSAGVRFLSALKGGVSTEGSDEKTRWLAGVDLWAARSVSRVVLRLPAGWGARTQTLSLQAGADGSTFTTVKAAAAYAFDPAADNTVTLTLPTTVQRWFRLTVTANSGWPAGQLSEFEVRSS
ncbi:discoidin domain-containing protein [Streptomyces mirabilis]|uniref:discoidin domain-containing protein n=1 Tax=Streptomyces mirabilis TaxID=68239 RepID=UPI00340AE64D